MDEKTIAAISTPVGVGGISIVRLSGKESLEIALKIFSCNFNRQNSLPLAENKQVIEPRKLYLGKIRTQSFNEKGLFVYFKNPNSYTGEDVVEFQCHGGVVIAKGILNELIKHGAKLAGPGEFTKRAFINGKLTLDEAEGVIDMINAESESEVRAGYNLMQGSLSKEINQMQDDITFMLAKIEVTLDYPEVDYEEQAAIAVLSELEEMNLKLLNILATSNTGMLIKNGTRVLILGKPNVGKSSLLNAMLNYDRAIVTDIKGTTRDTIEETYTFNGVKFVITDTAGVRNSEDVVEKIGIDKAVAAINQSDVVLMVLDASQPLSEEDKQIIGLVKDSNLLVLLNKTDLPEQINILDYGFENILKISALNKQGIINLKQKIYDMVIDENLINTNLVITNMRHTEVLERAIAICNDAISSLQNKNSLDLVSIDIKNLWLCLGEITGESNNEDIIDKIFSSFCLGK